MCNYKCIAWIEYYLTVIIQRVDVQLYYSSDSPLFTRADVCVTVIKYINVTKAINSTVYSENIIL